MQTKDSLNVTQQPGGERNELQPEDEVEDLRIAMKSIQHKNSILSVQLRRERQRAKTLSMENSELREFRERSLHVLTSEQLSNISGGSKNVADTSPTVNTTSELKESLRIHAQVIAQQKAAIRALQTRLAEREAEVCELSANLKAYSEFLGDGGGIFVTAGTGKCNEPARPLFPLEAKRLEQLVGFVKTLGKCGTFVEVCDCMIE